MRRIVQPSVLVHSTFTTMIREFGASSSHSAAATHPRSLIDGQDRACCSSNCPPPRHHAGLQLAQLRTAKCHSDALATTYQLSTSFCKQPVWSDVATELRAPSNHDHTYCSRWGVSPRRDDGIQWPFADQTQHPSQERHCSPCKLTSSPNPAAQGC